MLSLTRCCSWAQFELENIGSFDDEKSTAAAWDIAALRRNRWMRPYIVHADVDACVHKNLTKHTYGHLLLHLYS